MPTAEEYLQIMRRAGNAASPPSPSSAEDPGLFWKAVDILGRPYSTVMGAVTGAVDPHVGGPLEGARQGFMGERYFSVHDLAVGLGADPESNAVRYGSLAADILNPLDPLTYLTLGYSKAGRVAKGLASGSKLLDTAEVATRAAAAAKGEWAVARFLDKPLTPKALNVPAAQALDKVGDYVTRTKTYDAVMKAVGGKNYLEKRAPELRALSEFMKDGSSTKAPALEDFTQAMGLLHKKALEESGGDAVKADQVFRQASALVERPAQSVARVSEDLAQTEAKLAASDPAWRPSQFLDPERARAYAEAAARDQADLVARKAAIEAQMATAAQQGAALPQAVHDEHAMLKSMVVDPADLPPRESLYAARARLEKQLEVTPQLRANAAAPVLEVADLLVPLNKKAESIYEAIGKKYEAGFQLPILDHLRHMFPVQSSRWTRMAQGAARKEELAKEFAAKGLEGQGLQLAVEKQLKAEQLAYRPANPDAVSGFNAGMLHRSDDRTIAEVNAAYNKGEVPYEFEDHAGILTDQKYRDAMRYQFAHDVHDFVRQQPGWALKGEDWRALPEAEQKGWVKSKFQVQFLKDPKKDPFRDLFVRRDVNDYLQMQLGTAGHFTGEGGLDGLLQAMNTVRRWWSAWTLAPFPSFHVRNVATDFMLAHQGGLNPALDLGKGLAGKSSILSAMGLLTRNASIPFVDGQLKLAGGNLNTLLAEVSAAAAKTVSADELARMMQADRIIGSNQLRDLDFGALWESPSIAAARSARPWYKKAADYLPLQDPARSPVIKGLFNAGSKAQELPRAALWLNTLRETLPQAKSFQEAVDYATMQTRKHTFDYEDLTAVEQKYLKTAIPFYTWARKNMPRQIEQALTDPGRNQWVARLYNGAWGQFEEPGEIKHEDLPDWLDKNLGLPMRKVAGENGDVAYQVWSPKGWLPQTDLNDLADALRGGGFRNLISRAHPIVKEAVEQALNRDSFTGRQIDDGKMTEMFGQPMPARAQHLIRNLRLVNEIDKLNPMDVFTKVGVLRGLWDKERPHRHEAEGMERGVRALLGWTQYTVDPVQEAERRQRKAAIDMHKEEGLARSSERDGQHAEAKMHEAAAGNYAELMTNAAKRLDELRRTRAIQFAAQNSRR